MTDDLKKVSVYLRCKPADGHGCSECTALGICHSINTDGDIVRIIEEAIIHIDRIAEERDKYMKLSGDCHSLLAKLKRERDEALNANTELLEELKQAAPAPRGRWVKEKRGVLVHWHCSACEQVYYLDPPRAAYCPGCGAKMDGGADDGKTD